MSNKEYIPPYTLTSRSIHLVSEISELVGIITIKYNLELNPKLRRENRIRTIYASLAIENNSLSLDIVLLLSILYVLQYMYFKYKKTLFYMFIPYTLWVSFATALTIGVLILNR